MNTAKSITTSTNKNFRGKPDKKSCPNSGKSYLEYNGRRINLAKDWIQITGSWSEIFEIIAIHGYPIVPPILKNDYRISEHFVASQIVMVDIDHGMTLQDLANDPLYNHCGAGFYTTANHTPLENRFRIAFVLDHPITDTDDYIRVNQELINYYGGDQACKDPARLFYGTIGAVHAECHERILPTEIVNEFISIAREKEAKREKQIIDIAEKYQDYEIQAQDRRLIVELLHDTYVGDYLVWRSVAWAMKNSGFSLGDFVYVTSGMMRQKSAEDAARLWSKGVQHHSRQLTMGTIFYVLFQQHGKDNVLSQLKLNSIESQLEMMRERLSILRRNQSHLDG